MRAVDKAISGIAGLSSKPNLGMRGLGSPLGTEGILSARAHGKGRQTARCLSASDERELEPRMACSTIRMAGPSSTPVESRIKQQ